MPWAVAKRLQARVPLHYECYLMYRLIFNLFNQQWSVVLAAYCELRSVSKEWTPVYPIWTLQTIGRTFKDVNDLQHCGQDAIGGYIFIPRYVRWSNTSKCMSVLSFGVSFCCGYYLSDVYCCQLRLAATSYVPPTLYKYQHSRAIQLSLFFLLIPRHHPTIFNGIPLWSRSPITPIQLGGYFLSFLGVGYFNYQKIQGAKLQAEQ